MTELDLHPILLYLQDGGLKDGKDTVEESMAIRWRLIQDVKQAERRLGKQEKIVRR